jgi:dihydroorotate dehydrogenase electron transfer subunit
MAEQQAATPPSNKSHRGTIFVEDAKVLAHTAWEGDQYILRLESPKCAAHAVPGSFVHLTCDPSLPMRRPLSLMRVDPVAGWIEILYKVHGVGLAKLAEAKPGAMLSSLGPIGKGFTPHAERPRTLLIGGGVGIPPMVYLAEALVAEQRAGMAWKPLVLMGSEIPFPFRARPSTVVVPGIPAGTIAAMPLLEEWGVPSRLATLAGYAGCYAGYVTDLASEWLGSLTPEQLQEVEIFSCGPTPMLKAVAKVAQRFGVPCQVSLEEYMACAVGGCAGCAVRVETPNGPAMKRVCVDGPVFEASSVFPPAG